MSPLIIVTGKQSGSDCDLSPSLMELNMTHVVYIRAAILNCPISAFDKAVINSHKGSVGGKLTSISSAALEVSSAQLQADACMRTGLGHYVISAVDAIGSRQLCDLNKHSMSKNDSS